MNEKFLHWKTSVAVALIAAFLLAIVPITTPPAKAGLPSCLVEGFLKGVISSFADEAIGAALNAIDKALESLTFGILGGEQAVKERTLRTKEAFKDVAARCIARMVFDSSVNGMLEAVRKKGRDGGATYIRNWRNFQTNAQYRGEAVFRGILANTQTCDYLQEDVNAIFRVTDKDKISLKGQNTRIGDLDPFTIKGRCTLPSNFDIEKYKEDFSGNGGWGTFLRMLEPQNNYYGLVLQSLGEADKQRGLEISSDLNQALAGGGVLGISGSDKDDSCAEKDANGKCVFYKNIKTPGSYLNNVLAATVQQELAWITNVDELEELIIDNIAGRLTNRLLNLGTDEEAPEYTNEPLPPNICPDFGPDAEDPLCRPPEPTPVDCSLFPEDPSCSQEPPSDDENPPPGSDECVLKPPEEQFRYLDDIRAAQGRVTNRARAGQDVGLDQNDVTQITDFNKYHSAVAGELNGAGFPLAFHDGEEIQICRSGDGFSEHSDISTAQSRVRNAFNNAICRPASIGACNQ